MPSTMPAIAVSTSASSSEFCASAITTCVNVMPRPVMVTQPMTMPAQAQAIATASVLRAPSSSASSTMRQPMPSRVVCAQQRHRQAGERADQRAQRRRIAEDQAEQHDQDRA